MLVIDLRTSHFTALNVPDSAWVPIATAHAIVGAGRATVYRWYAQDRLRGIEIGPALGGGTIHVMAGDVRELHKHLRSKRHAEKRRQSSENVR